MMSKVNSIYSETLIELYSNFYTFKGMELAKERQNAAIAFYTALYEEVSIPYKNGRAELNRLLQ